MTLTYIFFDLDGTLVDSSEGIHNGFVQTFERLGLPVPSNQKIRTFMGPPLEVTFKEEISEEGADQAVKIYRDYYETKGQLEAHLYDGIKEVLEQLSKDQSVIVGDTKFDLIGGKTVGIKTIAVTWGFGKNETLLAENPDFIADTTQELRDILK